MALYQDCQGDDEQNSETKLQNTNKPNSVNRNQLVAVITTVGDIPRNSDAKYRLIPWPELELRSCVDSLAESTDMYQRIGTPATTSILRSQNARVEIVIVEG